ncbi:MAG: hypothetical protein U0667_18405 [Chloroflexota bacterium]
MAEKGRTLKVQIVGDIADIKKDLASVDKSVGGLEKTVRSFGKGAKLIGAGIAGAFAVDSVVDFAKGAIDAASDLSESMSKVNVVFGDSADSIVRWSQTSDRAMGLSQQKALEAAGTFGNLFDALGLAEDKTKDMSKGVVQLASDLASFNNADVTETLDALQSGLLGEAEPMRRFGASLSEARTKAYGMEHGLGELVKTGKSFTFVMTDAEKVQARYGLILEDTANAQGDFARTSDGLANKQRILNAQAENLSAAIGGGLMTAVSLGVDAVTTLGDAFHALWRVMNPGEAVVEDSTKLIREMAESYGFSADAVLDFVAQQEAASRATEEVSESLRIGAQWEAKFQSEVLDATGAMADGVITAQEQQEINEQVYRQMEDAGFVIDEVTGRWKENTASMRATQAATEDAQRKLVSFMGVQGIKGLIAAGGQLVDFWTGLGTATEDIANGVATDWEQAAKDFKSSTRTLDGATDELVSDLKGTKADVKSEMAAIEHALTHPFEDDDLERTYRNAVKDGTKAMNKALRDGNEEAYAEASAFVKKYKAKLRELRRQRFQVRVSMVVDDSGLTGPGATLLGGMVGSAWGNKNVRTGKRKKPKSHAAGLDYVPYDGYPALLHRGESVETERETAMSAAGGNTYHITNYVAPGGDLVEAGRQTVRAIQAFEMRGGKGWRKN